MLSVQKASSDKFFTFDKFVSLLLQISQIYIPRLSFSGPAPVSLSATPIMPSRSSIRASSRPGSAKVGTSKQHTPAALPQIVFGTSQEVSDLYTVIVTPCNYIYCHLNVLFTISLLLLNCFHYLGRKSISQH